MKKCITVVLFISLLMPAGVIADSLVPPGFTGYLGSGGTVKTGAVVRILINTETRLRFTSSTQDESSIQLTFSGGEGDGLFSFLPEGSGGAQATASGEEETIIETELSARVSEVDDAGAFYLRGSREIGVDRGVQRLVVEGWGNLAAMDDEGRIPFSSLADSVLSYRTFLNGAADVIRSTDLEAIRTPPETVPELPAPGETPLPAEDVLPGVGEAGVGEAPGGQITENQAIEGNTGPAPISGYRLTEEVRRDLLLQYLNQMMDLLFAVPQEAPLGTP